MYHEYRVQVVKAPRGAAAALFNACEPLLVAPYWQEAGWRGGVEAICLETSNCYSGVVRNTCATQSDLSGARNVSMSCAVWCRVVRANEQAVFCTLRTRLVAEVFSRGRCVQTVSYTHLTLPTKRIV